MNKPDVEVKLSAEQIDTFVTWFVRLCIVGFIILHPIEAALGQWRDGRPWERGSWFNWWCHLQIAFTILLYGFVLVYLLWTCFLWVEFPGFNL